MLSARPRAVRLGAAPRATTMRVAPRTDTSFCAKFTLSSAGAPVRRRARQIAAIPGAPSPVSPTSRCRRHAPCFSTTRAIAKPFSSEIILSVSSRCSSDASGNEASASNSARPPSSPTRVAVMRSLDKRGARATRAATEVAPSSPAMLLCRCTSLSCSGATRSSWIAAAAAAETPLFWNLTHSKHFWLCSSGARARTPFSPSALSDTSSRLMEHDSATPRAMVPSTSIASSSGLPASTSAMSSSSRVSQFTRHTSAITPAASTS
mmetsp:Transcript_10634/g.24086  ORF Transcript_10634/g.24086 Transcript_10634/m.24086 type:complete len:264 (-) Transcript_10634:483-1274(-)